MANAETDGDMGGGELPGGGEGGVKLLGGVGGGGWLLGGEVGSGVEAVVAESILLPDCELPTPEHRRTMSHQNTKAPGLQRRNGSRAWKAFHRWLLEFA